MGESVIFDRLPKLEILTVTHNYIHSYESFLYNLFSMLQNLRKLDISYQNTYVPSPTCGNQQVNPEIQLMEPKHSDVSMNGNPDTRPRFPCRNLAWPKTSWSGCPYLTMKYVLVHYQHLCSVDKEQWNY